MQRLAIILFLAIGAIAANAATYYVSPYGSGDLSGSDDANCAAYDGLTWATAGDEIHFRDPNYVISWSRWRTDLTYYTNKVHLFGIEWTLSGDVQCGQFINLDPWLKTTESATITAIYPASMIGNGVASTTTPTGGTWVPANGREVNGTMVYGCGLNEITVNYQAFDTVITKAAMTYNYGRAGALPISISSPGMILSCASRSTAVYSGKGWLDDLAVLTVVSAVPDPNSFRPGYCDTTATVKYTTADIDWACIESRDPCGVNAPRRGSSDTPIAIAQASATEALSTSWQRMVARPWPANASSANPCDYMAPVNNMPAYGYSQGMLIGEVGLIIHINHWPLEQRKPTIYGYLQIGMDWGSFLRKPNASRPNDGAHGTFSKWVTFFTGMVFDDHDLLELSCFFGEEGGTFYVKGGSVDLGSKYYDGGDVRSNPLQFATSATNRGATYGTTDQPEYVADDVNMPEFGIHHGRFVSSADPYGKETDTPKWLCPYRMTGNSRTWLPMAMAAMIVHDANGISGKARWGTEANAFCDYADRVRTNWPLLDPTVDVPPYDLLVDHTSAGDNLTTPYVWLFWTVHRPLLLTEFPVWNDTNDDGFSEAKYDLTVPALPTNLRASATTTSLTIAWDTPAGSAEPNTAYRLWWEAGAKATCDVEAAYYDSFHESNEVTITSLDTNSPYTISVSSVTDVNRESLSWISGTFYTDAAGEEPPTIPEQAQGFSPADDETGVSKYVQLSWVAGTNATKHQVYFGTDETAVTEATTGTPVIYRGEQDTTTYSPGTLSASTVYYWRVDEKNDTGTTKGATISFTTSAVSLNNVIFIAG